MVLVEFFQDFQEFYFCLQVDAVARLGFTGSYSKTHHLIKEAFGLVIELFKSSFSGLLYGIVDAAACSQDVKISCSLELERDLVLTVSAEDHVSVAFYKTGRHQISLGVIIHQPGI